MKPAAVLLLILFILASCANLPPATAQTPAADAQSELPSADYGFPEIDPNELHDRVIGGDIGFVRTYVARGFPVNARDPLGRTALLLAAGNGFADIAELLVSNEADVNARNDIGQTPLMYASQHGHRRIVQLLLENGADPTDLSDEGATATMYAAIFGHQQVVRDLLAHGGELDSPDGGVVTPLMIAANSGNADMVRMLVRVGARVDARDPNGMTALMYASFGGATEAAQVLLESGATCNAITPDRQTALTIALARFDTETWNLLVQWEVEHVFRELESSYLPFLVKPGDADRIRHLYETSDAPTTTHSVHLSDIEVPNHVTYVRHTTERNAEDATRFLSMVEPGSQEWKRQLDDSSENGLILGPHLTNLLKRADLLDDITFNTVLQGSPTDWTGWCVACGVLSESVPDVLRLIRNILYTGGEITVRYPNPEELDWHWWNIGWDLEDPLLVFENDHHSLLIEFSDNLTPVYVELMEGLTWHADTGRN